MRNSINYNYNINIENLEECEGYYRFYLNNKAYFFVPYSRGEEEIKEIIECSRELKIKGIDCHDLMLNKDSSVLTKVGDNFYVLLGINGDLNQEFSIFDMIEINNKLILTPNKSKLYRNNWGKMWSDKIDYFEYQIRELGKDKEGILNSFSYYIGLAENAISYVNKTTKSLLPTNLDRVTLSHRRLFFPNIKLNYLNPLSFIFDMEVRDIAEYIKVIYFFNDSEEALAELELYLKLHKLSSYGYQMLMARLLYPSYYFDIYEKVMNNECSEEKLIPIITKVQDYERFLSNVFTLIAKYAFIEPIEWLNKKVINQRL